MEIQMANYHPSLRYFPIIMENSSCKGMLIAFWNCLQLFKWSTGLFSAHSHLGDEHLVSSLCMKNYTNDLPAKWLDAISKQGKYLFTFNIYWLPKKAYPLFATQ